MSCCKGFEKWTKTSVAPVGGGFLYPSASQGQIEKDTDGKWHVVGCCLNCYVLDITHCPFCGAKL